MMDLVLASTSPWRKKMLENAGFSVRCVSPGVDEAPYMDAFAAGMLCAMDLASPVCAMAPDPGELALTLARAKASAVHARFPQAVVIGGDQVVTDGTEVWGKPSDPEDHLRQLQRLRGTSHELVSGFCVLGPSFSDEGTERTRLWVRPDLTDDELRAYVATGEGSGCAGGYAVEGRGGQLFERIEGDWFNVLGLPLLRVISVLRTRGWRLEAP